MQRIDYHKLYHGMAVIPYYDPKKWSEAMSRLDEQLWKHASLEKKCIHLKKQVQIK